MNWLAKLEKMKKELEDTVSLERRKLLMEQEMVSFKLQNLGKKIDEIAGLEEELEDLKKERDILKKREEDKITKKRLLMDIEDRIHKLKQTDSVLGNRGKLTEIKIKLLDDQEPFCPVCHKEMRYDEKVRARNQLLNRDKMERDLLQKNEEQLKNLSEKRDAFKAGFKEIDTLLMGKSIVFERIEELHKKIDETKKEAGKFRELEARDNEIRATLSKKNYAEVAQKVLKEINKEIKENL